MSIVAEPRGNTSATCYGRAFAQNGRVKHRTIANLSGCSPEEIRAIQLALSHKEHLEKLITSNEGVELQQGLSVGAVWVVYQLAQQLGIVKALGNSRKGNWRYGKSSRESLIKDRGSQPCVWRGDTRPVTF